MLYKDFYSELGKLLYAVADIDGAITQSEKKVLHEIVRKELVPSEKHKDEFGTDAAYYAEIEFEYLEEEIGDADAAFNSFIDFVEEHHTAFSEKMRKVCIHVAKEIANAYHKTNKKEKLIIKRLKEQIELIDTNVEVEL
jgi:uncharacterized tellurite resistance protein B-like protein